MQRAAGHPPSHGHRAEPETKPSPTKDKTPNDIEILVAGKPQQRYAERVEKSLQALGLTTDLMFPLPDITVPTFIQHIAAAGSSFAAIIKAENETHQSISIHVLRGVAKPEEHRNMPLAIAFNLIKDRMIPIRLEKFHILAPQFLDTIDILQTKKFLTDSEYQYLLRYIRERWTEQRILQKKEEYDPDAGISSMEQIQERIQNLLGFKDPRLGSSRGQPRGSSSGHIEIDYQHRP